MYLAISAVAAMCVALAVVQTRNAKRLGEDLRQKTAVAESFQQAARTYELAARDYQEALCRTELLMHEEQDRNHDLLERCGKLETALRESEDTACRLRQELQTGRKAAKELQEELDSTKDAHDAAISAMWSARNEVDGLKQERRKLNEALITERETAEHWKEEFHKEQAYRLSTEGRIMREVNNLLRYDGTAHGQEDLSDE